MSKTKGFIAEFKKFIARGNVLDLAVGVIIGGAFSAITNSLVNDIINPILGIFAGGNEALSGLSFQLPGGGALMLGNFINAVVSFVILAACVFAIVKAMNALMCKKEDAPAPPPAPSKTSISPMPLLENASLIMEISSESVDFAAPKSSEKYESG